MAPERRIELLDGDTLTAGEVDRALDDLIRSHRLLFGYRALVRTLVPRVRGTLAVRILDVGAGAGDVGERLAQALRRRSVEPCVVGVDRKLAHLAAGRRRGFTQLGVVAEASELPFRDDAFDWTFSHLVLHHFDPDSNRTALREMLRTAPRIAVVDLCRSAVAKRLVPLALRALRVGRVAYDDGVVSIAQASSLDEVRELIESLATGATACARVVEVRKRFPLRFSVVLERTSDSS